MAQLPTEQLHALLEAVQPLLKPSRKAKAPPTKSGGAGASSSKRKRRSKGDDASDEEDEGDEEGPEEEEPTHSSTADADDGRAFEGALLTLNVLTLPQIPRELFVDESLEGVHVLRGVLSHGECEECEIFCTSFNGGIDIRNDSDPLVDGCDGAGRGGGVVE